MMINCLAIDDEPLALRQLAAYIQKIPYLSLAGRCQSALEARRIIDEELVDAIFIDINMPDLSGLDFVRQLAAPPIIVFTTAYTEYAIEGYKVDAVDYLLKPFGLDEFRRAAEKVKRQYELENRSFRTSEPAGGDDHGTTEAPNTGLPADLLHAQAPKLPYADDDSLFLKTDHRTVRISISDIRYVEGMSEYVKIYFDSQRPITVLIAMKKLEERLPSHTFMRIHRSYIVNLKKIQEVNKNRVILQPATPLNASRPALGTPDYLPIGELYREQFNDYVSRNYLGK